MAAIGIDAAIEGIHTGAAAAVVPRLAEIGVADRCLVVSESAQMDPLLSELPMREVWTAERATWSPHSPTRLVVPVITLLTLVHRRTGETVRLAFSAQHDGRAGFKCKVGNKRLTLADLDPDAASAVRVAALSGRRPPKALRALAERLGFDMTTP